MNAQAIASQVALPRVLRGQVTAVCVVDDQLQHRVAWFDGLRKEVPDGPTFKRPLDAIALADYLNGSAPTPRGRPQPAPSSGHSEDAEQVGVALEAPEERPVVSSLCPGCGSPLPPGRHGQARATCSAACRQRVARAHRADAEPVAAPMGASASVTPSRPDLTLGLTEDAATT